MTLGARTWSEWALPVAFAGSVALHLLLLLIAWLAPSVLSLLALGAPLPAPAETRIHFTFAPPAERDSAGQAPVLPEPAPPPLPMPRRDTVPAPDLARPVPSGERDRESRRAARPAEPEPAPVEGAVFELPERSEQEPLRQREVPSPPQPEERPVDLQRALRQFDRALTRARESAPTAEAPPGGTPQHVFVPDFSALPTTGYGVGNLEFTSRDYDWSDYGRQIYIAIWRAWHNRLYLTTDEFERWAFRNQRWQLEHWSGLVFTIRRNGEVTDIAVVTPSGCVPLDDSAADALEEVVLPPLPADFPRDREQVRARFIAQGDIQVMRKVLSWRKARGDF